MSDEKQGMIPDGNDPPQTDEKDALDLDSSKVKFINANGGADAHVNIGDDGENAFCGLTKEELMKYADDPYWVRVRWILLILFWVAWFGMLAAAIVIIIVAPKCPPRPNEEWWQKSSVCQVYTRSYKDSNGDGIGDLKGIEEKLDYIQDNHAGAVHLSSIFKSDVDFGYGVVDHKDVDPEVGTMVEFEALRGHLHRKSIKLILDFIPNYVSKNHPWFQESRKTETNDYSDYFVWKAAASDWTNVHGDSAWTLDDERGMYYLHTNLPEQPDLNLNNPKVQEELKNILHFWLEKGVDGFRVVDAAYLFESNDTDKADGNKFQQESYNQIAAWRKYLDEYTKEKESDAKLLMVDVTGTPEEVAGFYTVANNTGADLVINKNLLALDSVVTPITSKDVGNLVLNALTSTPETEWTGSKTAWQLGNQDTSRVASRLNTGDNDYIDVANMLALLLPGTALTYYGEEIGMKDGAISFEQTQDILGKNAGAAGYEAVSRDPERTPMQWTGNQDNAGFTPQVNSSDPWLPVNDDYQVLNVAIESAQANGDSTLKVYRALAALRQEPSFRWGTYKDTQDASQKVFGFIRQAQGFPGFLVAANFDSVHGTADFHASNPDWVPKQGKIVAHTMSYDRQPDYPVNKTVWLDGVYLAPGEGVVFSWDWKDVPTPDEL